ncbi:response regulator transcription factor [Candidatus Pyrohabitans sp.]
MKKVLVVDDEEEITRLVKKFLESEGLEVVTANSGQEAISILETFTPDFIFLDLFMPEMSGWDVLREIRKRLKRVPVAMLTVQPLYESIDREEVEDIVDYITKPFDRADLLETLKQIPGFLVGRDDAGNSQDAGGKDS